MMRYFLPLLVRGLGCADVQVSVDLYRVGVDDLSPNVLSQLQGRSTLPTGSRAAYHHDLGLFHRPESKLPIDFLQGENRGCSGGVEIIEQIVYTVTSLPASSRRVEEVSAKAALRVLRRKRREGIE